MLNFKRWMREIEEGSKEEYAAFVKKKLEKYGVKSPADLKGDDKKKFYDEIDKEWNADHEAGKDGKVKKEYISRDGKRRRCAGGDKRRTEEDDCEDDEEEMEEAKGKSFIEFVKDCPDCYEGLNEFFFGNKKKQEPEKQEPEKKKNTSGFRYLDVNSDMSDYEQCWKKAYNVMLKNNMDGDREPMGPKDMEEKAKKKCEREKAQRQASEPSGDYRDASQGNYDPRMDGSNWSGGKPGAGTYSFA